MDQQQSDNALIDIRPLIDIEFNENKSDMELFMHETLRPILKFQHSKIISLLNSAPHFSSIQFNSISENNIRLLKQFLTKNSSIRMQLLGIIIGLMTSKELEFYVLHSKDLSKRIMEMTIVRFTSTLSTTS